MQVYSRVFVAWVIMEGVPGTTESPGLILVAYAWSIAEVVRYAYYFFALVDAVPYLIMWCRLVCEATIIDGFSMFTFSPTAIPSSPFFTQLECW